jgi:hypothetical protein
MAWLCFADALWRSSLPRSERRSSVVLPGAQRRTIRFREAVEFTGAVIFFEHKVPGLVIGAVRNGERAVAGFGEIAKGSGVVPDSKTIFRIGHGERDFYGMHAAPPHMSVRGENSETPVLPGRHISLLHQGSEAFVRRCSSSARSCHCRAA